ncbi:hypothetical protein HGRIS_003633, partial [Hohenbuehelia grisea]
ANTSAETWPPRATKFGIGRPKLAAPSLKGDITPSKSRIGSSLFSARKLSSSTTSITKSISGNNASPIRSSPSRGMPAWR